MFTRRLVLGWGGFSSSEAVATNNSSTSTLLTVRLSSCCSVARHSLEPIDQHLAVLSLEPLTLVQKQGAGHERLRPTAHQDGGAGNYESGGELLHCAADKHIGPHGLCFQIRQVKAVCHA